MNPIQSFDPIANSKGIIVTNGINKNEQIILFNSSLACLQLTFADKTNDILPPCWARSWSKQSPMSNISYSTLFTVPLNGQPISTLYGTLYEPDEHVADVNQSLQYVYVVGNPGGVPVSSVNELINTGNTPGTSTINIQPSDATQPVVTMDNRGNFTIYSDNAGVLTLLLELIAGPNPKVQIGPATGNTEILGNAEIDGIIAWNHVLSATNQLINFLQAYGLYSDNIGTLGTTRIWFDGPDRGEFHVGPRVGTNYFDWIRLRATQLKIELGKNTSPNNTLFQVSGGPTSLDNNKITTDANGNVSAVSINCGTPKLTTSGYTGLSGDQLSRLGNVAGSGSGTYNHTLGAIPDFVCLQTHANGSQTIGYYNETSTQITVVAPAGLPWFGLLTKRS